MVAVLTAAERTFNGEMHTLIRAELAIEADPIVLATSGDVKSTSRGMTTCSVAQLHYISRPCNISRLHVVDAKRISRYG